MMSRFLSIALLCSVLFVACPAKPATKVLSNGSPSLNPFQEQLIAAVETDSKREQRSPQFGFPGEGFGPFPEFDDDRSYGYHHKHHHKHHHRPEGCGEFGCGEGFGPASGYYPPIGGGGGESAAQASASSGGFNGGPYGGPYGGSSGGSQASASAGAAGSNGPFGGGGESQANAQSASFNFGPYSASFSVAEASSGGQRF
ncbi:PREDICTED: keratin, type I cytoskeletal 10-like [Dufourea novaeangliae]|uniref:keratin, type I cytoskeletal 10-like n=1 Tax=Dufourea novaeangliae TaxID=178035 RepID=UPI000767395B|nr:PREDICTED: keratin, type I cytoskeletal 10-like [Dufourea novaeangliae]